MNPERLKNAHSKLQRTFAMHNNIEIRHEKSESFRQNAIELGKKTNSNFPPKAAGNNQCEIVPLDRSSFS